MCCWERLGDVLDVLKKKKYLSSTGIRIPDRPAQSLVTVPTELPQEKKKCGKCGENFSYSAKYSAVCTAYDNTGL
jgi:hypothetical protein